ncbi:hypothetical protein SARC_06758 [Sphaeroforma arctica JP610]|uniref:Uncharacterized protein n=1 Tax=Sphaeroforma arctica JP610 TaxID=667725 RepID=A0A0L0FY49_9EUKA|nr:hypothetical protein SARC_06758 [Sphaeroforma arctica JP610]KNC80888.1 hypothetical protein SARC_06758 [Sphaeroforma arctica JP610]|eukprot:XP_014154790.1 hypothetical protein SARC_06758 [Sphaeroforma arctica JP610]
MRHAGNAVDFENGVSIRIKGTAQLQCGNDVSQAVVFNIEGLTSTGKTIFDGLCDFIGDNTLLSTQEHEDTAELISNGEEADVEVACADEPSISSHCAMDSVRCDDGQPTCAADGCKDGFINRKPASECVGVDGCTFQTRRVAMSEDAQWIVQAVAPIGIQTKISANQTLREKLVARLFRLDEMVGSWILAQDVLVPDNSSTDDNYDMDKAFGVSVAICRTSQDPDGKLRVLVGDTSAGLFGKQSAGEARVFTYHTLTGVLGLEQILQPQTHSEFDYFGTSVALSSDCTTAMIGAPGVSSYRGSAMIYDLDRSVEDGAPNYEGGVPVYIPSSVVQPLSLDGSVVETPNHFFGQAIATNHDASVVFMGGYSAGVVYVYREYTKDR